MNSRKKRFWKLWLERNQELARTDVKAANERIDQKIREQCGNRYQLIKHK